MSAFRYYKVCLDYMYETAEGGNQWSGPDAIAEHVTNKGTYCFINKENAEKHLDGFIKSRPDTEEWIEYECKLPVVMHPPGPAAVLDGSGVVLLA